MMPPPRLYATATAAAAGLVLVTYMNVYFGAPYIIFLWSSGQRGHTGEMFVWIIKSGIYVYLRSWGKIIFMLVFLAAAE